ncbi:LOW QUALITY PROTEIN: hypothetical protein OSB04_001921 [Centaurea solstitialis]|uniref:Uncharacterized protein n=1 Tax=Centaurea solstitialis TaxID=347529 RepID=A0AA38WSX7_9ASTR|nr:LOW QUALITY PROTEIN: hypothetical protein OSB04_001921 [Centaurea solstitialis]
MVVVEVVEEVVVVEEEVELADSGYWWRRRPRLVVVLSLGVVEFCFRSEEFCLRFCIGGRKITLSRCRNLAKLIACHLTSHNYNCGHKESLGYKRWPRLRNFYATKQIGPLGGDGFGFDFIESNGRSGDIHTFWDSMFLDYMTSFKEEFFSLLSALACGSNQHLRTQFNLEKGLSLDQSVPFSRCASRYWLGLMWGLQRGPPPRERRGSVFDARGRQELIILLPLRIFLNLILEVGDLRGLTGNGLNKLDRFLLSRDFVALWPNASSVALNRIYLDHCPILLDGGDEDFKPTLFRFQNS